MSNSIIRAYFETRLKTFADAQTIKIPIAFEGVPFVKPTDAPYLETFLLPANTKNPTTDAVRQTYRGMFQVNVCVPSGKGSRQGELIGQQIIDLFPVLPKGVVSVEQPACMHSAILDDSGWRIYPVDITYRFEV